MFTLPKAGKASNCKTGCNVPTVPIATETDSQEADGSDDERVESSSESSLPLVVPLWIPLLGAFHQATQGHPLLPAQNMSLMMLFSIKHWLV